MARRRCIGEDAGDLKGKRMAIVEGYSYGDEIDSAGPALVRSRSEEDSLTQLLKGGVDYTLMDELVVHFIVSNYPKDRREAADRLDAALTRELHFAVRRSRTDAESIVDQFNAQLRGMIADRTYHRLLHMDWIRADVDGDGVPEYVPQNDRPGPSEPQHVYTLFTRRATAPRTAKPGFYLGGNIYSDWASVPESYKAQWLGCAGSEPLDRHNLQIHLVSLRRCRGQPLTRRSSFEASVCHALHHALDVEGHVRRTADRRHFLHHSGIAAAVAMGARFEHDVGEDRRLTGLQLHHARVNGRAPFRREVVARALLVAPPRRASIQDLPDTAIRR